MNSVRVGDIGTTITGKTPSTKYSEYFNGDIMFVTPVDLKQNYYIDKSERYITNAGLDSIKKNSISGKSVLVGCIGSDLGNIAMVNEKCATNQQINSITNFKSEYSPEYIYYWFTTKKAWLHSIAGNTTTPIINKTDFDNITIQFPNRAEQDKIVSILSAIDEKISTNNKIIETSEKLMHEIYDYWFVQFDFSDENGRPYKSSGGEMGYNETLKREIPKGWEVVNIEDLAQLTWGQCPDGVNILDKDSEIPSLPYCSGAGDMDGGYIVKCQARTNNSRREAEDETILLSIAGTIGKMAIANEKISLGRATLGITPNNKKYYALVWLLLKMYNARLKTASVGAVQKIINKSNIKELNIAIPNVANMNYEVLNTAMETIKSLSLENDKLASLRDWLLPMLMNGQVKIKEK